MRRDCVTIELQEQHTTERGRMVQVYVNGELVTTVSQPSDAFDLGIDHDDYNVDWARVDLYKGV